MPFYKCILFFEHGKFGWSETYYREETEHGLAAQQTATLAAQRRKILAKDAKLTYHRVSDDKIARDAKLVKGEADSIKGEFETDPDKAYSTVLCRLQSGIRYWRQLYLSGVPDAQILGTDTLDLTPEYRAKVEAYLNVCVKNRWRLKAIDKDNFVAAPIVGIAPGNPIVVNANAHGLVEGDKVEMKEVEGTTDANGIFKVHFLNANSFSLIGTNSDTVYQGGGTFRKRTYFYPLIDDFEVVREVTRRRGVPFDSPRGRRRRKKV